MRFQPHSNNEEGRVRFGQATAIQVIAGVLFVAVSTVLVEPARGPGSAPICLTVAGGFQSWQEIKGSKKLGKGDLMDSTTIIQIVSGALFVIVLVILIQRRRTRVK
jgi:hypothetical protein